MVIAARNDPLWSAVAARPHRMQAAQRKALSIVVASSLLCGWFSKRCMRPRLIAGESLATVRLRAEQT